MIFEESIYCEANINSKAFPIQVLFSQIDIMSLTVRNVSLLKGQKILG